MPETDKQEPWERFWEAMFEGSPEKVIGRFVLACVALLIITACIVGIFWLGGRPV